MTSLKAAAVGNKRLRRVAADRPASKLTSLTGIEVGRSSSVDTVDAFPTITKSKSTNRRRTTDNKSDPVVATMLKLAGTLG